ncbi:MAG: YitT family protein [Negativicutes bacterium]|jgi:uncharacterized membrane-anchored protein YitT (DUF2179 family)
MKKKIIRRIYQAFWIILGNIISAIGFSMFLLPNELLSGGVSGIAMILYYIIHTPIGLMYLLFNIPLFIAAYFYLSREFFWIGLVGMATFSLALDWTVWMKGLMIFDNRDIIIASIFGGVLYGLGGGIVFRIGGHCGGLDIVSLIFKKYLGINVGTATFAVNVIIIGVSGYFLGVKPAMYSLIPMFVSSFTTNYVLDGFSRKKTVTIISNHTEEIARTIMAEVDRGATFIDGKGAYSGDAKQILLVVVSPLQLVKTIGIVNDIDDNAFVITQDASEVHGHGFSKVA